MTSKPQRRAAPAARRFTFPETAPSSYHANHRHSHRCHYPDPAAGVVRRVRQDALCYITNLAAAEGMRESAPWKGFSPSSLDRENHGLISQGEPARPSAVVLTVTGQFGGTWVHPELALKCAAWISPAVDVVVFRTFREVIQYGQPVAGLDAAAKSKLLRLKWLDGRKKEIAAAKIMLEERGLGTIAQFRTDAGLSQYDQLLLSGLARRAAAAAGEPPVRVYTEVGMRRAYSAPVLEAALAQMPPYLPGFEPQS